MREVRIIEVKLHVTVGKIKIFDEFGKCLACSNAIFQFNRWERKHTFDFLNDVTVESILIFMFNFLQFSTYTCLF